MTEAAEALKKWDGGRAPRGRSMGRGLTPSQLWGNPECHHRKIFENIGDMVYLGVKICILNNSVFNLDFGRSI